MYRLRVLFFFILISNCVMSQTKDTIIYVYDPMCGWCYGFSGHIRKAADTYAKDFEFEIISGGMVIGEREGPIGDFADYILGAYPRVEEYSGAKFGEPYLNQLKDKSLYSSSMVPSVALEVFKSFKPQEAIQFAAEMQKAYFSEGLDLRSDAVYQKLAKQFGIDETEFLKRLHSIEYKALAEKGFQQSAQLGVQGYPAVLAIKNGKYYALTRGFTTYDELAKLFEKLKTL